MAGCTRVVAAFQDPNPLVAGRGIAALREKGIDVTCGLLETEARELNVGFVSRMTRGPPWVRMKLAASLDGKIALLNGKSQWITGEAARREARAGAFPAPKKAPSEPGWRRTAALRQGNT